MGPVNLVAIEEYEEPSSATISSRTQHDDLVKAKAQLLEVINRINTQTKEMFTETFNQDPRQLPHDVHRTVRRRQSGPRS